MPNGLDPEEYYRDLSKVKVERLLQRFGQYKNTTYIENKLGNFFLYPNSVAQSLEDVKFELALFAELININPQRYIDLDLKKIFIPETFFNRVPSPKSLAILFADLLGPGIYTAALSSRYGSKNWGTVIKPEIVDNTGEIFLTVAGNKHKVKVSQTLTVEGRSPKVDIIFESHSATLLGKNYISIEGVGGELGVMLI